MPKTSDSTITPSMTNDEFYEIPANNVACTRGNVSVSERFALKHISPDDDNPYALLFPLTRWDRDSTTIHSTCEQVANEFLQAVNAGRCNNHGGSTTCNLQFDRVSHTVDGRGRDRQPAVVTVSARHQGSRYFLNHLAAARF
ncbi:hypothetical protein [Shewanella woodyi]|uniref:hypothetical protein n=1 Tax=Shewanella woodyi TaxID=60961 RepID=UPI0037490126